MCVMYIILAFNRALIISKFSTTCPSKANKYLTHLGLLSNLTRWNFLKFHTFYVSVSLSFSITNIPSLTLSFLQKNIQVSLKLS